MLFIPLLRMLVCSRDSPFRAFFIFDMPVNASSYQKLSGLIADQAERAGAHLIDLVVRGEHGTRVIEVYIDSEAGITSDLCSSVSREVGQVIDSSGEIQGSYRLEVSSPGINRALKFPWQYRKHIGRRVQARMQPGQDPSEVTGRLVAVDESGITIEMEARKEQIRIPFSTLQETSVKAPW